MKITPYTFVKLYNGDHMFVRDIKQRRIEEGLLPDKIVYGDQFNAPLVFENNPNYLNYLGDVIINMKTSSYQEIENFIYNYSDFISQNTWCYVEDIVAVVKRQPIIFTIDKKEKI